MDPEDAEDVLRLMTYEDYSAGGMMTTEPIVMSADYTVADALAAVRQSEMSPALASQVFITRQPLETPTGRFIGLAYTSFEPLSILPRFREILFIASLGRLSLYRNCAVS